MWLKGNDNVDVLAFLKSFDEDIFGFQERFDVGLLGFYKIWLLFALTFWQHWLFVFSWMDSEAEVSRICRITRKPSRGRSSERQSPRKEVSRLE